MSDAHDQPIPDLASIQAKIQHGDLPGAASALDALACDHQNAPPALYLRAVCQRHMGQSADAERTLLQLISLSPTHGRAFQELAHLYRDTARPNEAINAYATACHLNPALKASWRNQASLMIQLHQNPERIDQLQQHIQWLDSLPAILLASMDLMHEGKLHKAEHLCRSFMQKNPRHIDGMRILADIALRVGAMEDAEFLLESAVNFEPQNRRARIDYVQTLSKRQRYARAAHESKQLFDEDRTNLQYQSLHAIQCMQLGDFESALELFDSILETLPNDPVTLVSKGHALKTAGRTAEAIASYKASIVAQPMHCEAWHSLANLKTYTFDDHEIAQMQRLADDPRLAGQDRVYLQFALGKAFEDSKDYANAFRHYQTGNAIKASQLAYRPEGTTREVEDQKAACTAELFARNSGNGCAAPDPIFIVGLPRAGSTLLEQILSSHSMVDGTLELPNILSLSGKLRRRGMRPGQTPYPANLADLTADELRSLGEEYIEGTRVHRQNAPLFIDKMPNNFRHIGLIKLILPNAKIIDARRDPMACCFSGFKQLFAEGQLFSYSLESIGAYYRDYVELMKHWDRVIPGYVLRVQHEEVVGDLKTQVERMLDFCGLPFEEACLEFHKTERNIRTPSSEQVRQPIFSDALEQWRHFEPWLDPLKQALGQELAP